MGDGDRNGTVHVASRTPGFQLMTAGILKHVTQGGGRNGGKEEVGERLGCGPAQDLDGPGRRHGRRCIRRRRRSRSTPTPVRIDTRPCCRLTADSLTLHCHSPRKKPDFELETLHPSSTGPAPLPRKHHPRRSTSLPLRSLHVLRRHLHPRFSSYYIHYTGTHLNKS